MGVGKLGSMYGELTSISNMGSDQDSNPGPCVHQARTLNTAPSYYPKIKLFDLWKKAFRFVKKILFDLREVITILAGII